MRVGRTNVHQAHHFLLAFLNFLGYHTLLVSASTLLDIIRSQGLPSSVSRSQDNSYSAYGSWPLEGAVSVVKGALQNPQTQMGGAAQQNLKYRKKKERHSKTDEKDK